MKVLKVILYVITGLVILFAVLGVFGIAGFNEVKDLQISSVDLNEADDGTYTGIYENGRWSNTVEVTVKDHEITKIVHVSSGNSSQQELFDEIIQVILANQKVDIDTVSGATASTNSFLKAVENAFE